MKLLHHLMILLVIFKEKTKDLAHDTKERIKDTTHNIKDRVKDTTHNIKDRVKDTTHDIKDKSKDTAHDIKDKSKDTHYDIKDKSKDIAHDIKDKSKDTGYDIHDKSRNLSYESSPNYQHQKGRDTQEKLKDAAKAPIVKAQQAWETGKEKVKETFSRDKDIHQTHVDTKPSEPDMLSKNYHSGQPPATTEYQTKESGMKDKLAGAVGNAAEKAEHLISDTKDKFNQGADKAQVKASDTKYQAREREFGKEPVHDTRYSGTY